MRLFIAINFTEEIKSMLYECAQELKSHSRKGNFSNKDNLHLTLAFLGELPEDRIEDIEEAMEEVKASPFTLEFSQLGKFDSRSRGEALYWCGVKANPSLQGIQRKLLSALQEK